jgi:hypothetical protein
MKQYQRSSEKELTRFLVNEDYFEQLEYQDEWEELKVAQWSGLVEVLKGDNKWIKIFPASKTEYDRKIVDKVERVMKEMRERYWGDDILKDRLDEDEEYLMLLEEKIMEEMRREYGDKLFDDDCDNDHQEKEWEENICWEMFKNKYFNDENRCKLTVSDYEYFRYFGGNSLVDKVERVSEEMRRAYWDDFDDENWDDSYEEYFPEDSDFDDLIEDADYRDGEGMI